MLTLQTRTLEMVAVALSEQYGIKVVCNGQRASTSRDPRTGRPVITIPSVPLHDERYRALLRGYVDHEVGHVRFTDDRWLEGELLRSGEVIGALRVVCGIFEDLAVERQMGECFPGCRRNLRRLTMLVYGGEKEEEARKANEAARALALHEKIRDRNQGRTLRPPTPLPGWSMNVGDKTQTPFVQATPVNARNILEQWDAGTYPVHDFPYQVWTAASQYILYRVRSDAVPKLAERLPEFRESLDLLADGLSARLEPLLARVKEEGVNTQANMALARQTMEALTDYFFGVWDWPARQDADKAKKVLDQLRWILRNGGPAKDRVDMGKCVEFLVDESLKDVDENLLKNTVTLHHSFNSPLWKQRILPLSEEEQKEALRASAMMDAQMQALLQTFMLNRSGPVRTGKLNTNLLYRLFTGRTNIFYRNVDRRGIYTEVVVSVDMSGSMNFHNKADMASKALFSVAHSLSRVRGLALHIMGFFDNNVLDIVRDGDRVTPHTRIIPDGGTLCGVALNSAVQRFSRSTARKIVMMLTDGDANDQEKFEEAIERAREDGVEFLGIGILDSHILKYLPEDECCVISDMTELAPEILRMLRKKLGITG